MRAIFVAFSKPKSKWAVASHLIRAVERSEFSHALIRWYSPSIKRDMIYQASHGMAHFMSGQRFSQEAEIVVEYEILLTDEQFNAVMKKCVDLAGIKYGTLQLVGMGFERVSGVRSPLRDGSRTYVCSELVGEVLRQVYGSKIDVDLELHGPKKLEELVSKLPGCRRVF